MSTRKRSLLKTPSRSLTIRTLEVSAFQSNGARKVTSMRAAAEVETATEVASAVTDPQDVTAQVVVVIRPVTIAKSLVTSPENAAREEDQEADHSSKSPFIF